MQARETKVKKKMKNEDKVKTKHAGGRPKKFINLKQVAKLAKICCTVEEIANILDLSKSTLDHNTEFLQVYKKNIDNGKMSLRRAQMELALKGNATMQIWLGKQLLGQREPQNIEVNMNGFSCFIQKLIDANDNKEIKTENETTA